MDSGPGGPLAEAVASVIEIGGRERMQTQHAGLFGERPLGIIRNVIPLPVRIQFAAVKVVVPDISWLGRLRESGVRLDPGVGGLAQIARQSDERKAVVPSDGNQRNHAAGAAVVGHDDAPPFARRRLAHAALMQPQAAVIGPGASGCRAGHAQRLAINHCGDFPRPINGISAGDHLVHRPAGNGGNVVILAFDFVEVMAFAHSWAARLDDQLMLARWCQWPSGLA